MWFKVGFQLVCVTGHDPTFSQDLIGVCLHVHVCVYLPQLLPPAARVFLNMSGPPSGSGQHETRVLHRLRRASDRRKNPKKLLRPGCVTGR